MNRHRFGKGRVLGCECEHNYTCRACLDAVVAKDNLRPLQGSKVTIGSTAPQPEGEHQS